MKMQEIAHERDNGRYAKLGMMHECASYFNVDFNAECVLYIVDTYLECIKGYTFFDWIRGGSPSAKVMVMNKQYLQENFNDLLSYSDDLETLSDLFMYLYDQEMWIDHKANVLYSTTFNLSLKNRKKLNYIGIMMELERIFTLQEFEIITWQDIDTFVECLYEYGYDIDKDYNYREDNEYDTVNNIVDRLDQIFGGIL